MEARAAFEDRDSYLFLDVRERYEWDAGHIEDAVHIPITQVPARISEIPSDRTVVCVCQIGQRSELVARFLTEHGYEAHNLEGGMSVWQSLGLPAVTSGGEPGDVIDGWARDFNGLIRRDP